MTASRARSRSLTPLADRLHSAAIHLLRAVRPVDAETGLSGPRLSALSVIVFAGPISLGALARAEQVRPPTMTRLVAALVRLGLVRRERDPSDARAILLRSTPKGRRVLFEGRRRRVAEIERRLRVLPPRELEALARALRALERTTRGV